MPHPRSDAPPQHAPARASFSRARGLAELVASATLFGLMAYAAKLAARRINGSQVALVRAAVGFASVLLQSTIRRVPLRPVRWRILLLRGLFGGVAVLGYFIALANLPVGTATLLTFTSPVFSTIFAWLFLRERIQAATGIALGVAGVGVTLVICGQGKALGGAYGWQALALGAAVASGAAVTAIRAARRTDGTWEIFAVFSLVTMLCTTPLAAARWTTPTATEWGLLLFVGAVSVIAQTLMTHALRVVDASTSGTVSQLTVVVSLALGHFLDADPFPPLAAGGALLTLAGVSWAARAAARHEL